MKAYAYPEYLVETNWVAAHLDDSAVRIVESDEDALLYDTGHIPGAVKVDWFTMLQDSARRDFITITEFEKLCARLGIANDTTVVFYGDKSNWFAVYAFWLFVYYGHQNLRIMNGGRLKWAIENRELTTEPSSYSETSYHAQPPDKSIRAFRDDVFWHMEERLPLVDVRSPKEYSGEMISMPGYPQEGAQRGGHILGAVNIPWSHAVQDNGTFKAAEDLLEMYQSHGITPEKEIIAYCRIGERSSHTWFVLRYLLGYPHVRNYDGSWTEWGNLVGVPIRRGTEP